MTDPPRFITDEHEDLVIRASATFSPDRRYRYHLDRTTGSVGATVLFVMLNPSTADAFTLDPTIRRCMGFAAREHAGRVRVCNLFALRSTNPAALYAHPDPVGPWNDDTLMEAARTSDLVVAGWGTHGALRGRGAEIAARFRAAGIAVWCLGVTRGNWPAHPLYLHASAPLRRYVVEVPGA